ncbi:MAG: response regulator transcription factor [Verrucomicrobia bacterium]|nr:response regulator transcription factor [Verrucomicrobiota bacterium]
MTVPERPKILVVDDDPTTLAKLESQLDEWGLQVITASDADKAFDLLVKDDGIRAVMLDYMLTGMNGFELTKKIRAKLHSTPLHIIILTAKGGKQILVEAFNSGANDFLTKPFHPDELRARLLAGARATKEQSDQRRQLAQYENAVRILGEALHFIPHCGVCNRVRDLDGNWHKLKIKLSFGEEKDTRHLFICPECEAKQAGATPPSEPAPAPAPAPAAMSAPTPTPPVPSAPAPMPAPVAAPLPPPSSAPMPAPSLPKPLASPSPSAAPLPTPSAPPLPAPALPKPSVPKLS